MRAQQVKLAAYCLMKDWMLNRVIPGEGYRSKTLKCSAREEITVMVTPRQVEKESDLQTFMDNPPLRQRNAPAPKGSPSDCAERSGCPVNNEGVPTLRSDERWQKGTIGNLLVQAGDQ
jgi:hypothetical protein